MSSHERAATKSCTKCGLSKPDDLFSKRASWCKECINAYSLKHYRKNRAKVLANKARYRRENSAAVAEANAKWRKENAEVVRDYLRKYREEKRETLCAQKRAHYAANRETLLAEKREYNRRVSKRVIEARRELRRKDPEYLAKHNHSRALRRAAETQATPKWADMSEIEKFYREAQRLTKETGVKHSVDHIYPLRGKFVSGLHVPENLRVIPLTENCAKQNKVIG